LPGVRRLTLSGRPGKVSLRSSAGPRIPGNQLLESAGDSFERAPCCGIFRPRGEASPPTPGELDLLIPSSSKAELKTVPPQMPSVSGSSGSSASSETGERRPPDAPVGKSLPHCSRPP
jgi:hypothetical protein